MLRASQVEGSEAGSLSISVLLGVKEAHPESRGRKSMCCSGYFWRMQCTWKVSLGKSPLSGPSGREGTGESGRER